jgi:hypothetical protein
MDANFHMSRGAAIADNTRHRDRRRPEMAQLYFHCSNADELLIDRQGTAIVDLAEARDHAASVMRALVTARTTDDWREWVLHVADDLGDEIFALSFSTVLGRIQ